MLLKACEKKLFKNSGDTLELHYNIHLGSILHSDISVITEQPYNEGLIHIINYKPWELCL